jgi:hypothetical protein
MTKKVIGLLFLKFRPTQTMQFVDVVPVDFDERALADEKREQLDLLDCEYVVRLAEVDLSTLTDA